MAAKAKRIGVLLAAAGMCIGGQTYAQDAKPASNRVTDIKITDVRATTVDSSVAHLAGRAAFANKEPLSQQELLGVLVLLAMQKNRERGA
jgi:hypothetical protein